ncbi:sulfatase, partial [Micromonospora sp. M51]|nr:sulfatase [Micromonospora sp. M51]
GPPESTVDPEDSYRVQTRADAGLDAGSARVADLAAFTATDPDTGTLPALVWGDVPDRIPDGTLLAVAVNGRIGAVVPVVPADPGGRRFAALLADDSLFRAGTNTLDVYQGAADGALRRLALS